MQPMTEKKPIRLCDMTPSGREAPLGWLHEGDRTKGATRQGVVCTYGGDDFRDIGHRLIIGPTGSGKFQAAIAPLILTADQASMFIVDPKQGEAVRKTAAHRARLGPVLVLDPFNVTPDQPGITKGAINPLDLLRRDDPDILSVAEQITQALMPITSSGDNEYWDKQAQGFMSALLVHLATDDGEMGNCNLKRVREICGEPFGPVDEQDENANMLVLMAMRDNPACGGVVARAAKNILASLNAKNNNAFYIQQTLFANTQFLDNPWAQNITSKTTFDPAILRQKIATIYIPLHVKKLDVIGRWLRLIYMYTMERLLSGILEEDAGGRQGVPLHVVLDEFPALGRFDRVLTDMDLMREFRIQFHLAVQKVSQLAARTHYADGWQRVLPRFVQVLGSDEPMTARFVSEALPTKEEKRTTKGQTFHVGGGSQSTSESFQDKPFMRPAEINALGSHCLVIVSGMSQPLILRKWWVSDSDFLSRRITT